MLSDVRFLLAGELALVVEFGEAIDPTLHDRVLSLDAALSAAPIEGVVETVPTYRSLMIHFEPRRLSTEALIDHVRGLAFDTSQPRRPARRWTVPVCYEPPYAEDLGEVSDHLGLTPARIAALHASAGYRVYMYGFAPGFTFLGGLPVELGISRRAVPRPPAPPGSLLIAGGQALITSMAMPTGWYQIGRTPVRAFDPHRERVFLADIGDEVRFLPIDGATFETLDAAAERGECVAEAS